MFCPNCRSEFVPGVTHCPDCDVDLVEKLPPADDNTLSDEAARANWVMIYRPASAQEVALIKMIMERERIPCFIGNDNTRRAALFSPTNLAFELWAPEEFAERAAEVIREEL